MFDLNVSLFVRVVLCLTSMSREFMSRDSPDLLPSFCACVGYVSKVSRVSSAYHRLIIFDYLLVIRHFRLRCFFVCEIFERYTQQKERDNNTQKEREPTTHRKRERDNNTERDNTQKERDNNIQKERDNNTQKEREKDNNTQKEREPTTHRKRERDNNTQKERDNNTENVL